MGKLKALPKYRIRRVRRGSGRYVVKEKHFWPTVGESTMYISVQSGQRGWQEAMDWLERFLVSRAAEIQKQRRLALEFEDRMEEL